MFCLKNTQSVAQFLNRHKYNTRPNASPGLWLMFLLPLSLIISAAQHPIISTSTYKLSTLFSFGLICTSLVFIFQTLHTRRLKFFSISLVACWLILAVLFRICLHRGVLFSIWSALLSTVLYHKLYLTVLEKLPNCFTLGEAAVCCQSYILLLYFTLLNTTKPVTNTMQMATVTIQLGLFGISANIILAYKLNFTSPCKFYTLTLFIILFVVLLPLQILIKENPLLWIAGLFWDDLKNNKVVLYWIMASTVAILAINNRIQMAKKASTSVRKIFHILTVAVFVPGLLYNCSFLYLASGVILGIFFMLEIMRVLHLPPLAEALQNGLVVFSDEKDAGIIAFTPMYLLAGCSLPLWIHPAPCDVTNSAIFSLLPLLSGLLTTGIGDTAASIVGSKIGRFHWHGSKKTVEGTFACIASQLLVIFIFVHFGYIKLLSEMDYAKVVVAVLVSSVIEAKTDQVDNLVLPFVMYIFFITI